jgi:GMP synthase (glutamine-hydrolysing)
MVRGVLVLDFGSQYTQLICRRIREQQVFSEILPYWTKATELAKKNPFGLILSGGPASVYEDTLLPDRKIFNLGIPILGICYGHQVIGHHFGARVKRRKTREYGKRLLQVSRAEGIFSGVPKESVVWMSHGDEVESLPKSFHSLAKTETCPYAAITNGQFYGLQFHPEVSHTEAGNKIIKNFLFTTCHAEKNWRLSSFTKLKADEIRKTVGDKNVICGLSGGIDSTVTALLVARGVPNQLYPIFVDNGLLRTGETEEIVEFFKRRLNLHVVDGRSVFLRRLEGVRDPEKKRHIIGRAFIELFEKEARRIGNVGFLAQGTIYPDVIESGGGLGPSARIKSHHNVGGLPKQMKLRLVEPLRELFKDEVRKLARYLGVPPVLRLRHPFPGPGLAVRIIGSVTEKRLAILKQADQIIIDEIRKSGLEPKLWQVFAVLLPVRSSGVMGDQRTYENVVALRAVESKDGMTADWARLPYPVLERIASRVVNEVERINRVVYDVTSKPPATIEWE